MRNGPRTFFGSSPFAAKSATGMARWCHASSPAQPYFVAATVAVFTDAPASPLCMRSSTPTSPASADFRLTWSVVHDDRSFGASHSMPPPHQGVPVKSSASAVSPSTWSVAAFCS